MGVQTLRPESTVERLDVCIVRRLSWPGEVERYALGIGPEIKIAADELGAFIDTDRLWIADLCTHTFQRGDHMGDEIAGAQPIPRFGEAQEVARMVRFLFTEATYSTGSEFTVDRGAVTGQVLPLPQG